MESLMFTLAIAAVAAPIFMMKIEDGARAMWEERNEFITVPNKMVSYKSSASYKSAMNIYLFETFCR